jgi:hypothetical protein
MTNTCPSCGSQVSLGKGMVYKNHTYCDSDCVEKSLPTVELKPQGTNHEETVQAGSHTQATFAY